MKIRVLAGSLHFEMGTFSRGDIIEVPDERVKLFDKLDYEDASAPITAPEEAKNTPASAPSPAVAVTEAEQKTIDKTSPVGASKPKIVKKKPVS